MIRRRRNQVIHDGDAVKRHAILNFARACADERFAGRHAVNALLPLNNAGRSNGKLQRIAAA